MEDLMPRIAARLHWHTTVLIRIPDPLSPSYEGPIGSGTLVQIGKTFGVLTARHVAERLEIGDELGLTSAPQGELHAPRIPVQELRIVSIGTGPILPDSLDLSFIRLPDVRAWSIRAWKGFYNLLAFRDEMLPEPRPRRGDEGWTSLICGAPEQFSWEEGPSESYRRTLAFRQMCWQVEKPSHFKSGGSDYFDILIDRDSTPDIPDSFAGMSGGGVWYESLATGEGGELQPIRDLLVGVIFYQIARGEGKWTLRCHAWASVYGDLLARVAKEFGEHVERPDCGPTKQQGGRR